MAEDLIFQIEKLKEYNSKIVQLFEFSISGSTSGLYDYDLYIAGAANRAIAIINSFSLLIFHEPLGAIALIRIHLDTLLRVNAPIYSYNSLDFIKRVMKGEVIQKLEMNSQIAFDNGIIKSTSKTPKLLDSNLIICLKKLAPRIEIIYKDYCDDIHFSGKAIEKAVHQGSNGIHFSIGTNKFIAEAEKTKAIQDMIYISEILLSSISAYIVYKASACTTNKIIQKGALLIKY